MAGQEFPKMNYRKALLEEMLNDSVKEIRTDIYGWRDFAFQVLPYKQIKKGWSQFVKREFGGKVYGVRELSQKTYKKLMDEPQKNPVKHFTNGETVWTCPYCEGQLDVYDRYTAPDDFEWRAECKDCKEIWDA